MKKWLVFILGLVLAQQANGQKFEIGLSAGLVKELAERDTKAYNQCDTCSNRTRSYRSIEVKYHGDKIAEVIECYRQEYLPELKTFADYCEHYIMDSNKLAYVRTLFENIPAQAIRASYRNHPAHIKIGELYFSNDYEHYSDIYTDGNGRVTIEWRQTVVSALPEDIRSAVGAKLTAAREKKKTDKAIAIGQRDHDDSGVPAATGQKYPLKGYTVGHSLAGRHIALRPDTAAQQELKEGGKVVLRVTVDREGTITDAVVVSAANTIIKALALQNLQSIRFNKSTAAPPKQFGLITFQFKGAKQ